ncbi:hypothetical protein CUJ83_11015 [Methanocella sp. CWC-04]|uniref:Uncharacterized protein n=2 Tax=Methanooceanicella nereidis TaxID=2052831 RepID=A0AAP2W7S8_9EURY|nr:hypothetical protein [Methanocella sp. CWC-04]
MAIISIALMFMTALSSAAKPDPGSFDPYGIGLINAAGTSPMMGPFSQIYGMGPGAVTGPKFAPVIEYGMSGPSFMFGDPGQQYGYGGFATGYGYGPGYAGPGVMAMNPLSRMNILAITGFINGMFSPGFGNFNTGVLEAPKVLIEKWEKESKKSVPKKPSKIENASKPAKAAK